MRMDQSERQAWCNRATELGCPSEKIKNSDKISEVILWCCYVSEEMKELGLWENVEDQSKQKHVMLPFWNENCRGLPNDILRSALFAATKIKDRKIYDKEVIATIDGVEIICSGKQLDQSDLIVWEQLLHIARTKPLEYTCEFTAYDFLISINVGIRKEDYQWLNNTIYRLLSCTISIKKGDITYIGGLVRTCVHNDKTKKYELSLDSKMINLYYKNGWTALKLEMIQTLRNKPLARWLANYYATHAKPYPIKVDTIMNICGSKNKSVASFKKQLLVALDVLQETNTITRWSIDEENDLIVVDRGDTATQSQQRHLKKKCGITAG